MCVCVCVCACVCWGALWGVCAGACSKAMCALYCSDTQAFGTADGQIIIGAGNNELFSSLCDIIGLPHLATDEKYSTNEKRVKNREELIAILTKRYTCIVAEFT